MSCHPYMTYDISRRFFCASLRQILCDLAILFRTFRWKRRKLATSLSSLRLTKHQKKRGNNSALPHPEKDRSRCDESLNFFFFVRLFCVCSLDHDSSNFSSLILCVLIFCVSFFFSFFFLFLSGIEGSTTFVTNCQS